MVKNDIQKTATKRRSFFELLPPPFPHRQKIPSESLVHRRADSIALDAVVGEGMEEGDLLVTPVLFVKLAGARRGGVCQQPVYFAHYAKLHALRLSCEP